MYVGLENADAVAVLRARRKGKGAIEPIAMFKTNPAGAAVVSAVGCRR